MQLAAGSLVQNQQRAWMPSGSLRSVVPAARLSDPRPAWRGFFVAFSYWFGFYFGGYRQTPARAGARTLLD